MKKNSIKMICTILALTFCASTMIITAEARSSLYIDSRYASVTGTGNGKITVNFDITGTGRMTTIGATKIEIKSSSGSTIKTYKCTDIGYEYMMGSNRTVYSSSVTYQGVSGNSYYAVVSFKAGNGSGSDTATYTTLLETA